MLHQLASGVAKTPSAPQAGQRAGIIEFNFLFPLCAGGSAWDLATDEGSVIPERECLRLFRGACAGVLALHRAGYAHRDLKPHNILLDAPFGKDGSGGRAIVMDLGSAAKFPLVITSRRHALEVQDEAATKCSAPYRAPELFEPPSEGVIGAGVDVWSLGCTLYAMAFGWSPFESAAEGLKRLAILNGGFSFPDPCWRRGEAYSPSFCSLISAMLVVDSEDRPSLEDVLVGVDDLLQTGYQKPPSYHD
jgi:serine/threonine kinase 16